MGNVIFLRTVLRVGEDGKFESVFHPLCDGGLSTKERERESLTVNLHLLCPLYTDQGK